MHITISLNKLKEGKYKYTRFACELSFFIVSNFQQSASVHFKQVFQIFIDLKISEYQKVTKRIQNQFKYQFISKIFFQSFKLSLS